MGGGTLPWGAATGQGAMTTYKVGGLDIDDEFVLLEILIQPHTLATRPGGRRAETKQGGGFGLSQVELQPAACSLVRVDSPQSAVCRADRSVVPGHVRRTLNVIFMLASSAA